MPPLSPAKTGAAIANIVAAMSAATARTTTMRLTALLLVSFIVSCCPIVFLLFG